MATDNTHQLVYALVNIPGIAHTSDSEEFADIADIARGAIAPHVSPLFLELSSSSLLLPYDDGVGALDWLTQTTDDSHEPITRGANGMPSVLTLGAAGQFLELVEHGLAEWVSDLLVITAAGSDLADEAREYGLTHQL